MQNCKINAYLSSYFLKGAFIKHLLGRLEGLNISKNYIVQIFICKNIENSALLSFNPTIKHCFAPFFLFLNKDPIKALMFAAAMGQEVETSVRTFARHCIPSTSAILAKFLQSNQGLMAKYTN